MKYLKKGKEVYFIENKPVDITNEDWDILVILDACRYDCFKKVYEEVLGKNCGSLKLAISPATWTVEWLNKTFGKRYYGDMIYISANPFVNSKKRICHKQKYGDKRCFDAKKHFFKVIDVWAFGWSDDLGTVHPVEVNKAFHRVYLRYPKKRFIIHYMQPHQPYITVGGDQYGSLKPVGTKKERNFIKKIIQRYMTQRQIWYLKKIFKMPATSNLEKIYRKYGKEGIIKTYTNEIKFVLNYVKMLIDSIEANWVITSDHGERLENFWIDTHGGRRDKEVIEVPWLEIKKRSE